MVEAYLVRTTQRPTPFNLTTLHPITYRLFRFTDFLATTTMRGNGIGMGDTADIAIAHYWQYGQLPRGLDIAGSNDELQHKHVKLELALAFSDRI